jgi:transposase
MWAVAHTKDVVMPKLFPPGFKRDVVAVARSSGLTQAQVAHDFGVSENLVARWVEQAELVALRRRARVLEQEVEILRRATAYFAEDAALK